MDESPLVSLILCVKNGMPFLPEAVRSVARQTYRNLELIVQDGGSTDGSLEFLRSVSDVPNVSIVSAPDGGIGDAYNRAIVRCRGEIVGTIDADNLLEPDALERVVAFSRSAQGWAATYGSSRMITPEGHVTSTYVPPAFDLLGLLRCEVVPPFGQAFYHRERCGQELRFDPALRTCADFDIWLRLAHLSIVRIPDLLGSTRVSAKSMTCRPGTYDQYCADKITALRNFLKLDRAKQLLPGATERHFAAGIYAWAAEAMLWVDGGNTERFSRYKSEAEKLDPYVQRLSTRLLKDEGDQLRKESARLRGTAATGREAARAAKAQLDSTQSELEQVREELRQAKEELAWWQQSSFGRLARFLGKRPPVPQEGTLAMGSPVSLPTAPAERVSVPPGSLEAAHVVSQCVQEDGSRRFQTVPQRWSYAFTCALGGLWKPTEEPQPRIIRVDVEVHSGKIGLGCVLAVANDCYVTEERHLDSSSGRVTVELPIDDLACGPVLVLRNTAGQESEATLHGIEVLPVIACSGHAA